MVHGPMCDDAFMRVYFPIVAEDMAAFCYNHVRVAASTPAHNLSYSTLNLDASM